MQRVREALKPIGDSLPDWEIILRLSGKMNCSMPYSSPHEIMNEIAELVPMYSGVDYAKLDVKGYRLGKDKTTSGQVNFSSVEYTLQAGPEDGYPLTLLVGTILFQFGTGSRSLRASRLKQFLPEAFVALSKLDAGELEVKDGDRVKVVSPMGEVAAVAKVVDKLNKGMVFIPVSFPESQVNGLFGVILDPRTKAPALKACQVRLERIGDHG